jgi:hypothetical protein
MIKARLRLRFRVISKSVVNAWSRIGLDLDFCLVVKLELAFVIGLVQGLGLCLYLGLRNWLVLWLVQELWLDFRLRLGIWLGLARLGLGLMLMASVTVRFR